MSQQKTKFIENNAVTNVKLADMAQSTIKGRAAGAGTGDPTDLTSTQATAILDLFTSSLQGLVPASGGGTANFLRADGTFAAPSSSSSPNYDAFANLGLAVTASAGALTIALKQADASTDPASGTGAVVAYFRDSSLTGGNYIRREVTSALSLVVPSGATLGIGSTVPDMNILVQVYLIDDGGTVRLGVRTISLDTSVRGSSTAIGTGSDSADVMYSDAATTNKARTLIGILLFNAAGLNGTWVAPSQIKLGSQMRTIYDFPSQIGTIASTAVTTGTSGNWITATGNSIVLPPGIYQIMGGVEFNNSGTTPAYTIVAAKWSSANGGNSTTEPASAGFSNVGGFNFAQFSYGASNPQMYITLPFATVTVTSTTSLFMDFRVTAGVMGNISVTANGTVLRVG